MRNAPRRSASLASMADLISWANRSCKVISVAQLTQFVPQLGSFFVILTADRFFQCLFHALFFGQWPGGTDLFEVGLQGLDLRALIRKVGPLNARIKLS